MICQVSGELTFSIERHRLDRSKRARAHTHERPARRASDMHSWALVYSACTHESIPNPPHKGAHACIHHMGSETWKQSSAPLHEAKMSRAINQSVREGPSNKYIYICFKAYIIWLLRLSQCKVRLRTQGSNAATYTRHGVVRLDARCNAFAPPGDALLSLTLSLPLPLSRTLSLLFTVGCRSLTAALLSFMLSAVLVCARNCRAELLEPLLLLLLLCDQSRREWKHLLLQHPKSIFTFFFNNNNKKKCHAARMQRTVWSVSTAKLFVVVSHLSTRLGTLSPSLSLFYLLLHPKCWWHSFSLSDPSSPCRPSYPSCRCLSPVFHSNQSTHGPLSAAGGNRCLCFSHFCA